VTVLTSATAILMCRHCKLSSIQENAQVISLWRNNT